VKKAMTGDTLRAMFTSATWRAHASTCQRVTARIGRTVTLKMASGSVISRQTTWNITQPANFCSRYSSIVSSKKILPKHAVKKLRTVKVSHRVEFAAACKWWF